MQSFLKGFKDSDIEGDATEGGNIKTFSPLKLKGSSASINYNFSKKNKFNLMNTNKVYESDKDE